MKARPVPVHEGPPKGKAVNGQRWIRLVVRKNAGPEDQEAEALLRGFADALSRSQFGDEFVLSIFRINPEREESFGLLPKIETNVGCEGISNVRRYLSTYTKDIQVPLVI